MRVLMVNHPGSGEFRGGDLVQMRATASALRYFGVEVVESLDLDPSPTGFDLAHVFNLRTTKDTLSQLTHLKSFGIPVVLSPLYIDPAIGLWGSRAVTGLFQDDPSTDILPDRLANLRDRKVSVSMPGGAVFTAQQPNRPFPDYDRAQKAALGLVDFLLVNSLLEMHALIRTLGVINLPFAIAPLGIDLDLFGDPDPEPFVRKFGRRDFVLQVGRIEAPKNQLLLAIACKRAGLPLALIGSTPQPQYIDWIKKYGPQDLLLVPHLPQGELAGAYAASRICATPSWAEVCSLVNLEAAACGTSVVTGNLGYEVEYLGDMAEYCDPADVGSIQSTLQSTWENHHKNASRRQKLRLRVLEQFTWHASARSTFEAYCRVLNRF